MFTFPFEKNVEVEFCLFLFCFLVNACQFRMLQGITFLKLIVFDQSSSLTINLISLLMKKNW